jgi:hypothetical protein
VRIVKKLLAAWATLGAVAAVSGLIVKFVIRPEDDPGSPRFSLVTVFDGTEFRPTTHDLVSSKAITVFGGTQIDLRRAAPAGADPLRLELTTVMGGTDVTVPDTWRVSLEGTAFGGGHEIKVADHNSLPEDAPHLVVVARTIMGGLRVQARPVLQSA